MNEIVQLFQKMYNEVNIEDGLRLSQIKKVVCHEIMNAVTFDVDDGYPDTFYEIERESESLYKLYFRERGNRNTKFEGENANIAVIALFTLLLRFIPKSETINDIEETLTIEIRNGNISGAKQLIIQNFGDDVVSFDKIEYGRISVIPDGEASIDILYQDHPIVIPTVGKTKPSPERGDLIVFRECWALYRFNRVISEISGMIGDISQQDKDKIAYVYLTGLLKMN